jgi:acyl-CoA reductase-like NAD-dependent aldehyde dehydrogenase
MPESPASAVVKERYNLFRVENGKRVQFESADFRDLLAPWDHSRIASLGFMNEEQALENLATLKRALDGKSAAPVSERIQILKKAAKRVEEKKEIFADLIAWEGGKPLKDAKVEVARAINTIELAASEAGRFSGTEIPMRATPAASGHLAFTFPEPVGVVLAISAFNHPLNLIAHQVAPAIASGCPVMVKPASETPLSCLHLLEEFYEAGLSPEMCLPLLSDNEVAETIAKSRDISFMSFIGSAKVGWYLRSVLHPGTRFSLEHGGSAPAIVDHSADLDQTIAKLIPGAFYHSGQVCVSVQRIFVQESRMSEFTEKFVTFVRGLKVGDARLSETDCGPMIRVKDVARVAEWVDAAKSSGAKILSGGKKISETCYEPTVIADVGPHEKVMKEEVFGPVVCINSFKTLDEAIARANETQWEFQSAIFTSDLEAALKASRNLKASAVMINESTTFRVDWMPFRGDGPSGFGTGGIPYGMRDLLKEKMIVFRSPSFNL